MTDFLNDIAGLSMVLGILSVFYGLSMYKWNGNGWKMVAAPLAVLGVIELGISITVFIGTMMGILTFLLFGGVVCFALFRIGQENA